MVTWHGSLTSSSALATTPTANKMSEIKEEKQYPNFALAQLRAAYERERDPKVLEQIMAIVKTDKMLFYYKSMCASLGLKLDLSLVSAFQADFDGANKKIEAALTDAKENAGDVEIKNALLDRAELYNRMGEKEESLKAYEEAQEKTVGIGGRMDNVLSMTRICLFFDDNQGVREHIAKGWKELKKGGDFERKNKLKVYEGIFKLRNRDYKGAAALLLDAVPTFTAVELISMSDFVFYTVLAAMIGIPRSELKKRVINSPEVLQVIHERPHVKEFLFAYYNCDYRQWTREFIGVIDHLRADRYFTSHLMYITKALRLNAYRQFITSYKSVTITLMAQTFGVTREFLDEEIYLFISQGKLACKIDKVAGLIETMDQREAQKTEWYKTIIKEGDELLNKMQKLAAAIAV